MTKGRFRPILFSCYYIIKLEKNPQLLTISRKYVKFGLTTPLWGEKFQTRTGQSTEVQDNDMESVRKTFKGISLALGAA